MDYYSLNPATGVLLHTRPAWTDAELDAALAQTAEAAPAWRNTPLPQRAAILRRAAALLRERPDAYASLIVLEMGKPIHQAREEIEKCALACDFYADHAARWLEDEAIATEARASYAAYEPMGTVLAVMPWNFPFWQVFRCAAPILVAGNCALLKHAPNVPQCAAAIDELWREAGLPPGVFRWLPITHAQAEALIAGPRVQAVTLTGSEKAGHRIAALAGAALKKTVLELGGSDPFVVLEDADMAEAVAAAVTARFQNAGQSCIAAKRFILVEAIADEFLERFRAGVAALAVGDPLRETTQVGPLARADLRGGLQAQVEASIRLGAVPVLGCAPLAGPGFFYAPSILDRVWPGMPAYDEEVFGPVAAIVRAGDAAEALALANRHRYGLGASVWTRERERGERFARGLECGLAFVNGGVRSDPRLPFGGVKASGYGRELGGFGLREFVNVKTVWVD
ncbi:NAD-dependent succinate-semialdehyde dehydrogenase [Methylomagnum ishizawai]|uniref:NAD-dependent succinate-semialdehyde dehydrogenase n=1 Tax=Methylomagnum ishizawai TaxID=1760988 RepID=UPI001C331CB9|nr:NAD-dependent succinate-semialdehyde dehydrogenase [Methylomagnum ishizawai]BBL74636.1 succinate-semialdehyde dehydrogenase [Methylomagnum ishizawai]